MLFHFHEKYFHVKINIYGDYSKNTIFQYGFSAVGVSAYIGGGA